MNPSPVHRALISVSNKQGLIPFAQQLHELGIELISTGGTAQALREVNIPVRDVSVVTGCPEMMGGRVKTLHPKIHGGILGRRQEHADVAAEHGIEWIDLVVVNLYPFAETIKQPNATFIDAIENIDIGGPAMIRSAAKNMEHVAVVVDPSDYDGVLKELFAERHISLKQRRALAQKAFAHTAHYDACIHQYLCSTIDNDQPVFPEQVELSLDKAFDLRYGENPNQRACAYQLTEKSRGLLHAEQYQGKALSYNNLVDADAAIACVEDFEKPTCVIVKHANPCGIACAETIADAFAKAFETDSVSAFGGVIALNRSCDEETATAIANIFFEVIVAPSFSDQALQILSAKPNLRVLKMDLPNERGDWEYKWIGGGFLMQERVRGGLQLAALEIVTEKKPSQQTLEHLLFAWRVVTHVKSNAIVIANHDQAIGIGAGQVSRIDAVDIAVRKAGNRMQNAVLASDAFFPFRDSIDRIANIGIHAIIQPGGSIRDQDVIAACNEHGIAMALSGVRCFKH